MANPFISEVWVHETKGWSLQNTNDSEYINLKREEILQEKTEELKSEEKPKKNDTRRS